LERERKGGKETKGKVENRGRGGGEGMRER